MSNRALLLPSSAFLFPNANPRSYPLVRISPVRSSGNGRLSRPHCSASLQPTSSMELPLLPFRSDEVLIPSESKTLHLYEARYLALLEESMSKRSHFVHFVLDPVISRRSPGGTSFAARFGCLVLIESIKRLDVGALVSIRGLGRVTIVDLLQMEPYLRGVVVPMLDNICVSEKEINKKFLQLKECLDSLHKLEIKLKAKKDELLQTPIRNSLLWAQKEDFEDCDQAFIPELVERTSFAALQPVSGMSDSELLTLQNEKLRAMNINDTMERLENALHFIQRNISMVAAKLAIQTLGMQ